MIWIHQFCKQRTKLFQNTCDFWLSTAFMGDSSTISSESVDSTLDTCDLDASTLLLFLDCANKRKLISRDPSIIFDYMFLPFRRCF